MTTEICRPDQSLTLAAAPTSGTLSLAARSPTTRAAASRPSSFGTGRPTTSRPSLYPAPRGTAGPTRTSAKPMLASASFLPAAARPASSTPMAAPARPPRECAEREGGQPKRNRGSGRRAVGRSPPRPRRFSRLLYGRGWEGGAEEEKRVVARRAPKKGDSA